MGAKAGTEVEITWNERPARAWVPAPITSRDLLPDAEAGRRGATATGAVLRVGDRLSSGLEPLARLLLRTEGVASSRIEGVRAPAVNVALAEIAPVPGGDAAAWVADNLAVVDECLAHARSDATLDVATLHGWHRRLMRHGDLDPDLVGRFRDRQGWIVGMSPQTAAYVPSPPEAIGELIDDLLVALADDAPDPVSQAALIYAQFETIHPYGDGNGRIGRLLVLWVLARRLGVAVPPPVSALIARDPGGYLSGLTLFRTDSVDPWFSWFASVVDDAATASLRWADDVDAVRKHWRDRLAGLRSDAAAWAVVAALPERPVLSAGTAADITGVSPTAARTALAQLAERGVLESIKTSSPGPGRPPQWWAATELLDLVTTWSG